ncbi:MAG TPA: hypothetical protein VHO03_08115 [Ignavibacteriales bacterium]|nr:hypothetical protein [Ignavibacteriales bacterium]
MRKLTVPLLFLILAFAGCKSSILDDPSTTIQFSISEKAYVKVTVANSYNTVVATLVDGVEPPGVYQPNLDMQHLPEGMYFYTVEAKGLETGNYTKKTTSFYLVK